MTTKVCIKCGIDRKLLKRSIMTKPYNATYLTICNYQRVLNIPMQVPNNVVVTEADLIALSRLVFNKDNDIYSQNMAK